MDNWARNTVTSRSIISIDQCKPANGNAVLRELFELLKTTHPTGTPKNFTIGPPPHLGEFVPQIQ